MPEFDKDLAMRLLDIAADPDTDRKVVGHTVTEVNKMLREMRAPNTVVWKAYVCGQTYPLEYNSVKNIWNRLKEEEDNKDKEYYKQSMVLWVKRMEWWSNEQYPQEIVYRRHDKSWNDLPKTD